MSSILIPIAGRLRLNRAWDAPAVFILIAALAPEPLGAQTSTLHLEPALVGMASARRIATLAVVQQARILKIPIKEGDTVQEGELLVQLDDGFQRAKTEIARSEAESLLSEQLAAARWQKADRDLKRLNHLHGGDFASSKELSDAYAETEIRGLEHELARFAREQAQKAYSRERALLEQFQIRAPFRGYVSKVQRHPGETVDTGDPILVIAQLDQLEVVVSCPIPLAARFRTGQSVRVRAADGAGSPRTGTVLVANRVADAASQTFELRIAVDNTEGSWLAGVKVSVALPAEPPDEAHGSVWRTRMSPYWRLPSRPDRPTAGP